jgi:hypothetical protein
MFIDVFGVDFDDLHGVVHSGWLCLYRHIETVRVCSLLQIPKCTHWHR